MNDKHPSLNINFLCLMKSLNIEFLYFTMKNAFFQNLKKNVILTKNLHRKCRSFRGQNNPPISYGTFEKEVYRCIFSIFNSSSNNYC